MILINFIANRYFNSSHKNKVLAVTVKLALIGIMLGVAALIVVNAVLNGYREKLVDNIIGVNGYIRIANNVIGINNYDNIRENIFNLMNTQKTEITALIDRQAVITSSNITQGVNLKGMNIEDLKKIKKISTNIILGNIQEIDNDEIIIGSSIASNMQLDIGSKLNVIVPTGYTTIMGTMPRIKSFTVKAIFNSGLYLYDNSLVFTNLDIAQKLFQLKDKITTFEIYSDNSLDIQTIKNTLKSKLPNNLYITDWRSENTEFINALDTEKVVMFIILSLITLVSAFNILSSLTILVSDKIRDIAILRTFGISKSYIMGIFILTGIKIGIKGTFLGVISGILIAKNIDKIKNIIEKSFGLDLFNPVVYYLNNLPSKLDYKEVIIIALSAIIISLLATIYPAHRASSIMPAETLKNEG